MGTNLSYYLLNKGHEIIIWDNLSTGVIDIELLKRVKFRQVDIQNIYTKENIYIIERFDGIFNLACAASPCKYQLDPIHTILTSVVGVNNLLKLATDQNIPILQSSTSEIYGDPLESPQKEENRGNVNPIGIRSCYDEGKRCAESLCFDYLRKYDTNIKIARIFNTFGPKMCPQDGRVISNFINQIINNCPMTIYGTGEQTRSFCYVDDLIEGLYMFMISDFHGPINIGNPQEYTINKIAILIKKLMNSNSEIIYCSLPMDDPLQRKPDISVAFEQLGWYPKIDISDGLKLTIDYFLDKH